MSNKVKYINKHKRRKYYLFDDLINKRNFDPNNIKLDEKS